MDCEVSSSLKRDNGVEDASEASQTNCHAFRPLFRALCTRGALLGTLSLGAISGQVACMHVELLFFERARARKVIEMRDLFDSTDSTRLDSTLFDW